MNAAASAAASAVACAVRVSAASVSASMVPTWTSFAASARVLPEIDWIKASALMNPALIAIPAWPSARSECFAIAAAIHAA